MEVQIISKETIKPSSPTPPHLKIYKISLLDYHSSPFYLARVLFYHPYKGSDSAFKTNANCSDHLKKSLSETLTKYYPFAGRVRDGVYIDCNDEGVEFVVAQISSSLLSFLNQPEPQALPLLFPSNLLGNKSYKGSLTVIQINYFECGGLAVSVGIMHVLVDGCAMSNFINDWATMARDESEKVSPAFIAVVSSCSWSENDFKKREIKLRNQYPITRRFVFDASKIANLKAMAQQNPTPTHAEVVTALLHKCAMAAYKANSSSLRPSILIQTVNMRPKMIPPLPGNYMGNFSWNITLSLNGEMDINLHELVSQMRKGMSEFNDTYREDFKVNEWLIAVGECIKGEKHIFDSKTDSNVFIVNNLCGFPFYQVDFGWGKPVWVAIAGNVFKDVCVLMDTPCGDGIEAWVTLDEQEMAVFENDEELLGFCSLNPKVVLDAYDHEPI